MDPDPESIKFVTDFSKKTGDYASLSATDIKVMALALMLEIRNVGNEHLKKEPTVKKTVEFYKPGSDQGKNTNGLAGFYTPEEVEDDDNDQDSGTKDENESIEEDTEQMDEDESIEENDEGAIDEG